jgi:hypothetical protein
MTKNKLQINYKRNIQIFKFSKTFSVLNFKFIYWCLFITWNLFFGISNIFNVSETQAQTKTNLEIFYSLVDSSVIRVVKELPADNDSVSLELNLGESYSVFNNKIIASLYSLGKIVTISSSSGKPEINFVIDRVATEYGEIFRSSLLGEYLIPRNLSLSGNFLIQSNSAVYRNFTFTFSDTIKVDEVESVQNESFPFTRGKVPSEPFFSGLFEPVIAIGTAALAVILFFTIRSK